MNAITRIPRRLLIGLVRLYRLILSPHIGGGCRFTPTCSEYSIQAIDRYGAFKGSILSIHRILRCNPWGGHGYDPPVWYGERGPAEARPQARCDAAEDRPLARRGAAEDRPA